jgi:hypothetical protein
VKVAAVLVAGSKKLSVAIVEDIEQVPAVDAVNVAVKEEFESVQPVAEPSEAERVTAPEPLEPDVVTLRACE